MMSKVSPVNKKSVKDINNLASIEIICSFLFKILEKNIILKIFRYSVKHFLKYHSKMKHLKEVLIIFSDSKQAFSIA